MIALSYVLCSLASGLLGFYLGLKLDEAYRKKKEELNSILFEYKMTKEELKLAEKSENYEACAILARRLEHLSALYNRKKILK